MCHPRGWSTSPPAQVARLLLAGLSRARSVTEQRPDGPGTGAVHRRAGTAFPDALSQARRIPERAARGRGARGGLAGMCGRPGRRSPPPCPVNGSTAGVGCVACVMCSGVCLLTQPDSGPLGQAGSSSTTSVRVAKEPGRDDRSFNVSFKRLFCRTLPPFGELHKYEQPSPAGWALT